jgi:hypothetical protein
LVISLLIGELAQIGGRDPPLFASSTSFNGADPAPAVDRTSEEGYADLD